ncbi:hypothetical protein GCM10009779_00830 [Polymorphospora rubra]|uniref:Uncharacterized protein n=1 Tax=Polymorphospora rubra TaxID=338584 RepID=A0A810N9F4_9ACTN|nr:hypothetical protein Prubr_57800 [Polymorphospora rubra]
MPIASDVAHAGGGDGPAYASGPPPPVPGVQPSHLMDLERLWSPWQRQTFWIGGRLRAATEQAAVRARWGPGSARTDHTAAAPLIKE